MAPVRLRLPWKTPRGLLLAGFALFAASRGWFAGPLGLSRAAELTLGIALTAAILWVSEAIPLFEGGLALGTAVAQSGLAHWTGGLLPAGKVSPFALEGR